MSLSYHIEYHKIILGIMMQYWYCQFVAIVQDYADIKTVYLKDKDILVMILF
jgi:hypothetical protein